MKMTLSNANKYVIYHLQCIYSMVEFQSPNFVAIYYMRLTSVWGYVYGGHDSLSFIFLSLVVMMSHIPLASMFMSLFDV